MAEPMRAWVSQKAVLFAPDGDVLLLDDDGWEFPGGRVDSGERPETALLRECREEIGHGVTIRRPVHTALQHRGEGTAKYIVFYRCATEVREVRLSDEHGGFRWCAPEDARSRLDDRHATALDRALEEP